MHENYAIDIQNLKNALEHYPHSTLQKRNHLQLFFLAWLIEEKGKNDLYNTCSKIVNRINDSFYDIFNTEELPIKLDYKGCSYRENNGERTGCIMAYEGEGVPVRLYCCLNRTLCICLDCQANCCNKNKIIDTVAPIRFCHCLDKKISNISILYSDFNTNAFTDTTKAFNTTIEEICKDNSAFRTFVIMYPFLHNHLCYNQVGKPFTNEQNNYWDALRNNNIINVNNESDINRRQAILSNITMTQNSPNSPRLVNEYLYKEIPQ
jgi:hypothetical protein